MDRDKKHPGNENEPEAEKQAKSEEVQTHETDGSDSVPPTENESADEIVDGAANVADENGDSGETDFERGSADSPFGQGETAGDSAAATPADQPPVVDEGPAESDTQFVVSDPAGDDGSTEPAVEDASAEVDVDASTRSTSNLPERAHWIDTRLDTDNPASRVKDSMQQLYSQLVVTPSVDFPFPIDLEKFRVPRLEGDGNTSQSPGQDELPWARSLQHGGDLSLIVRPGDPKPKAERLPYIPDREPDGLDRKCTICSTGIHRRATSAPPLSRPTRVRRSRHRLPRPMRANLR